MLDMDFKSLGYQRGRTMFLNTVMSFRLRSGHLEKAAFPLHIPYGKVKVIEKCERTLSVNCKNVGMVELCYSQGDACQCKSGKGKCSLQISPASKNILIADVSLWVYC